ncbi:MAG: 50S ribosomal protein L31 [Campylobacterales bacterium]|nr:50S ribosomal protein L31 [Campylobacterales bacterium]
MKKDFHPESFKCEVSCACGNAFTVESTTEKIRLDICDKCHPFFTGQNKMVDAAGRIEKFNKKYGIK